MDFFIFFLPYIVLAIIAIVALTVPLAIWFVGLLLKREDAYRARRYVR
jgi:hypothetical protein